ncbi:hypothetical protein AB205_0214300, partial [Aquarana catesbeiana]
GEVDEGDGGVSSRPPTTAVLSSEKEMVRQMMTHIFRCIEPELNNLIALGDKIDSFNSLYMLVKMSHHVWTAENVDSASFLSTTLGNVLVTVKRNFDKCIVGASLAKHSCSFRVMLFVKVYKPPPPKQLLNVLQLTGTLYVVTALIFVFRDFVSFIFTW